MNDFVLYNGIRIPSIGFGTWQITDKELLFNLLSNAYDIGYRLIDTASAYGNEIGIGRYLKDNSHMRESFFIQDKVWNTDRSYIGVQDALKKSLKKLKIDYVDAYLIHWPASMKLYSNWNEINAETWRGMEKLYDDGLTKSIGICNFKIHHIEELLKTARIMPMINQIELHPGLIDFELINYCKDKKIHIEASSPFGNGRILNNEVLNDISKKYNISNPELILYWLLDKGVTAIPKTVDIFKLKQNYIIKSIRLLKEDIDRIDGLPFIGGLNYNSDEVTCFG